MRYLRRRRQTTEVDDLIGDASKAAATLGWTASTLTPELATIMVDSELAARAG